MDSKYKASISDDFFQTVYTHRSPSYLDDSFRGKIARGKEMQRSQNKLENSGSRAMTNSVQ
jgi:hypothetical protein